MNLRTALKHRGLRAILGSRYLYRGTSRGKPRLYLTFDDGPHPEHTPALLELLRQHDARATFFLVGTQARLHPDLVAAIVEQGHETGNHSDAHFRFHSLSTQDQLREIEAVDRLLASADGREAHWFRPPQGVITPRMALALALRRQPVAMWSYDSLDYRHGGVDAIVDRMRKRPPRSGDVLLFHDDNADTVAALARLLPAWKEQGFAFPTLSGAA